MSALPILLLVVLLFLAAIVLFRTAVFGKPIDAGEPAPSIAVDKRLVAEHLSQAIQFSTISEANPDPIEHGSYRSVQAFLGLHRALQGAFPRLHRTLPYEVVQGFSLLYIWPGSEPDLKPVLLMAHLDVVPVEGGSESAWAFPPFSGTVADGFVWGRGAMDYKSGVIGIMEAVEWLLRSGFTPRRTIYLAFGHDEEMGGMCGERRIASLLKSRGVQLESVLDEGGAVVEGIVPGVSCPVALIGVAEKGYLSLDVSVESQGGHSAIPGSHSAIGRLSRAIHRLEGHPMPSHLHQIMPLFKHLGSELPFQLRLILANTWLLGPIAERSMSKAPKLNALIRTTAVPTLISGGVKDNILPRQARAVVNCRLMPGDTIQSVVEHVRRVIDDPEVKVYPQALDGRSASLKTVSDPSVSLAINGWNPPAVTPSSGPEFDRIVRTVTEIFPDAVPAPFVMMGASDSRHYSEIAQNIFRFLPIRVDAADLERMHGVNERLSLENCAQMVRFYIQWIQNSN